MKRLISAIMLAVVLFLCSGISVFATNNINSNETFEFVCPDGTVVEYLLDEFGYPYKIVNGEKNFLAIGLEEFEVKDVHLISELNAGLKVGINSFSIKSLPSSYFYLSASKPDENSIAYEQSVTLPLTSGAWTSYLKYYAYHDTIRIRIMNVSGGFPLRRISIDLYYYSEALDKWYVQRYDKVRCTSSTGFAVRQILSAYQYGRFWLMRYDSVSSCDLSIWTTYAG